MQQAAAFFEREWKVDAGLLFCRPQLLSYYEALGWQAVEGPVTIEQPEGAIISPLNVMTLPLRPGPWASASIELQSYPW